MGVLRTWGRRVRLPIYEPRRVAYLDGRLKSGVVPVHVVHQPPVDLGYDRSGNVGLVGQGHAKWVHLDHSHFQRYVSGRAKLGRVSHLDRARKRE
jgi:hypothetical protein